MSFTSLYGKLECLFRFDKDWISLKKRVSFGATFKGFRSHVIKLVRAFKMLEYFCACVLVCGLSLGNASATFSQPRNLCPSVNYTEALDAFSEGKMELAIRLLQRVTQVEPRFADAYFNFGLLHHIQKADSEAIWCYKEVLRISPHDLSAIKQMNICLAALRRSEGSPMFDDAVDRASGLAYDDQKNLYVSNFNQGRIDKIAPGGERIIFSHSNALCGPTGLACDAKGNVYVANYANGTVAKLAENGLCTMIVSGLKNPYKVTLGTDGKLYVNQESDVAMVKIPLGSFAKFSQ